MQTNLSISIDASSRLLQLVNGAMFQGTRLTVWYIWNSDWRRRKPLLVPFPLFLFQLDFVQAENYLISQLKLCIYYFGLQYLKSSKKLQDVLLWSCNWEGGGGIKCVYKFYKVVPYVWYMVNDWVFYFCIICYLFSPVGVFIPKGQF